MTVKAISEKHKNFHFNLTRDYLVQGVRTDQAQTSKNTNYLSDSGWFDKSKFPVTVMGAGSVHELPKGPNEAILWNELENAISTYRDLMLSVSG
jgi:hypothetical protein